MTTIIMCVLGSGVAIMIYIPAVCLARMLQLRRFNKELKKYTDVLKERNNQ